MSEGVLVGDGVDYHVYSLPSLEFERVIDRPTSLRDTPGTIAFDPQGRWAALTLDQERVGPFDAETFGRLTVLIARARRFVGRASFDPTARKLAFSSHVNQAHLWHLDRIADALRRLGLVDGDWPRREAERSIALPCRIASPVPSGSTGNAFETPGVRFFLVPRAVPSSGFPDSNRG
ncbi:MAG: hypothetical protein AAFZ65_00465 [Planctomycetota bacterium]